MIADVVIQLVYILEKRPGTDTFWKIWKLYYNLGFDILILCNGIVLLILYKTLAKINEKQSKNMPSNSITSDDAKDFSGVKTLNAILKPTLLSDMESSKSGSDLVEKILAGKRASFQNYKFY